MEFFQQTMTALRGPQDLATNTVHDTIAKLADRCSQSTQLADRRAAVLALRGLSRDYKQETGQIALQALLSVLEHDAQVDEETAKAVLQTLHTLCEVDLETATKEERESALANTDTILAGANHTHKLFELLGENGTHVRLGVTQLLNILLANRRLIVQSHFINAPDHARNVLALLEEKRDIIRTEGLTLFQSLITQNTDIQTIFSFGGSFETLLKIVAKEGGVEGGVAAYSSLTAIDALLRFNISTQNYFRELLPALPPLLLFPSTIAPNQETPQEFSLQYWDGPKAQNAGAVLELIGIMKAPEHIRLLTELGISSNAPTALKIQALRLLSTFNQAPSLLVTVIPYAPVPETNGEEWDRLEAARAIDLLVSMVLEGEYSGVGSSTHSVGREDMELRSVALGVFEQFAKEEAVATEILQAMIPGPNAAGPNTAASQLLSAISTPLTSPLSPVAATRLQYATLLFSCLFHGPPNHSTTSPKAIARGLGSAPAAGASGSAGFFVPADHGGGPAQATEPEEEDEPPSSLLQLLTEHLSLSMLARSRCGDQEAELRLWDRVIVAYLALLSTWLWDDPKGVRIFLEGGGIGVLVEPISQTSGIDILVQGLCAFLFGVCYHFNREIGGEISRRTLHSIITRLGADQIVARMGRVREDDRFRHINPDSIVASPSLGSTIGPDGVAIGGEIWLDWGFVEFWKSNYYTVQKGLSTDPDANLTNTADAIELQGIITSLREVIRSQADEIQSLKGQLSKAQQGPKTSSEETKLKAELEAINRERDIEREALQAEISTLSSDLSSLREKSKEQEKEQEDLLVFLEEVNEKRKRDKAAMRKANLDVSEDEEGDDDDE